MVKWKYEPVDVQKIRESVGVAINRVRIGAESHTPVNPRGSLLVCTHADSRFAVPIQGTLCREPVYTSSRCVCIRSWVIGLAVARGCTILHSLPHPPATPEKKNIASTRFRSSRRRSSRRTATIPSVSSAMD